MRLCNISWFNYISVLAYVMTLYNLQTSIPIVLAEIDRDISLSTELLDDFFSE